MSDIAPWATFSADPRRPESAPLRASDADRTVVLDVLSEGYAEGRLTKEEFDDRSARTSSAKTLGELSPLIGDLVPERRLASPVDLQARAEARWREQRREALFAMLVPSLICWAIWVYSGLGEGSGFAAGFPWPIFVTLGTGAHLARVVGNRQDIVAHEVRRLEKKQRKALEG